MFLFVLDAAEPRCLDGVFVSMALEVEMDVPECSDNDRLLNDRLLNDWLLKDWLLND